MPTISQWPVVVSLPGEASVQRPYAPAGVPAGGIPASGLMLPRPSRARLGSWRPRSRAMLPRVSLPGVAICGGVGHFADTYAIEDNPDDSAEHKFDGNTRHSSQRAR